MFSRTYATGPPSPASVGRVLGRPRLILHADCPTCGPVNKNCVEDSAVLLALAHSAVTGHVVVLNGTTDLPELDDENFGEKV